MKRLLAFVFSVMILISSVFSQEYNSNKQSYLLGYDTEFIDKVQLKKVIIKENKIYAELPNGEIFNSDITFNSTKINGLKQGKMYDVGESNILVVYEDEIFLNVNGVVAATYYLDNYSSNNKQEQAEQEQAKQYEYDLHLKLYGKLTADCIRDKNIKIGMNYMGIFDILGEPNSTNTTETANGLKQQFVYSNMYIYSEGQFVIAIQNINK